MKILNRNIQISQGMIFLNNKKEFLHLNIMLSNDKDGDLIEWLKSSRNYHTGTYIRLLLRQIMNISKEYGCNTLDDFMVKEMLIINNMSSNQAKSNNHTASDTTISNDTNDTNINASDETVTTSNVNEPMEQAQPQQPTASDASHNDEEQQTIANKHTKPLVEHNQPTNRDVAASEHQQQSNHENISNENDEPILKNIINNYQKDIDNYKAHLPNNEIDTNSQNQNSDDDFSDFDNTFNDYWK